MFVGWDIAALLVAVLVADFILGVWSEVLYTHWRHRH